MRANRGLLDDAKAAAIAEVAGEVARGDWDAEFPIDVFQTGSGTSSNMNANEVLASLAAERLGSPVHPNDDVNDPLSSNDQFPSAIHVAATKAVVVDLKPALDHLADALAAKAAEFATVVKSGRTHLMDATPVTLGQEFAGYAAQVRYGLERLDAALPRVAELPLGGTAVGTGINAPAGFAADVIALLADETGLPLTEARDHFEAQGARDGLVELSGALRTIAVGLNKISNDIRWMGSGPRTGLTELFLPDLQPGSSIMPGKVNPVLCEAVCQVVAQVIGNDAAVAFARGGRQLRAQRDAAGDGPQRARVDPAARQREPGLRRPLHRRARGQRRAVQGVRRVLAVDRHAAESLRRLRRGRQDREAGAGRAQDHPRGGRRTRARPRPDLRGEAGRGARRAVHDPSGRVNLRAVVFDFYGTLAPGRSAAAQVVARTEQAVALGVDPAEFDAELNATMDERFRGAGGSLIGQMAWVARRLGVEPGPDALAAAVAVRLKHEGLFAVPRPDAEPVLRTLHERGLRIGVVSDCSAELPAHFADLPIARYVDAPVFSFVTGHRKPAPENYLACCAALEVEPADCLYVGDGGSNELAGARSVGMRAVHLSIEAEAGGPVYEKHTRWDGEVVSSLSAVLALV